jgi:hypothetical protein
MKRRCSLLLSAVLATAAAVVLPVSPASAGVGVCAGTGDAFLTSGLLFPITVLTPVLTPGLPHPLHVTVVNQPVTTGFTFALSIGTCVNSNAPTLKSVFATGVVSGWCGLASGAGIIAGKPGLDFAFIAVGPVIVLTGGLVGVVNATEDPLNNTPGPGDECNENKGGGETHFLITGAALAFDHCSGGGLTPVPLPGGLTTVNDLLPVGTISAHPTGTFNVYTNTCTPSPVL